MRPAAEQNAAGPDSGQPPALTVWEFAGLMLTYWCASRCALCYVNAGPRRREWMSVERARGLWRGLDALAAAHGKTMRIHLAGGEPFGDWARLASIVRAARDAGLTPLEKIETNAFWATDDGLTRARLELLDALGMCKLVVSSDVFHQEFVPFDRVRRCVKVARQVLGEGRVIVRWWDFFNQPLDTRQMAAAEKEAAFRTALDQHKDRMTGRAARSLAHLLPRRPASDLEGQNCVAEVLQSRHVHIDHRGHVFPGTCGGIILGRALDVAATWRALAANWRQHPVIDAVVAGGSFELLHRVRPLGYRELPGGYADKCHLCAHIREFLAQRGVWPDHVGPRECYEP